jgi:hypothetical protein
MNWKYFSGGVVIGLIIGILLCRFLGNRYKIQSVGPLGVIAIKLDTWTGQSWEKKLNENNWREIKTDDNR